MRFWRNTPAQTVNENPFRALDPVAFDKGAKINRRAEELQRIAAEGFTEPDTLTALGNALGNQVAAMISRHRGLSIHELLHLACQGVHEQAFMMAGEASRPAHAKELTEQEFRELAARIVSTATTNTLPNDAICATAKALGALISYSARRDNCSTEELVKFSQKAVATFAQEALAFMDQNPATDPTKRSQPNG